MVFIVFRSIPSHAAYRLSKKITIVLIEEVRLVYQYSVLVVSRASLRLSVLLFCYSYVVNTEAHY